MEADTEQEGMSTGKKVVAGAAVGLAVPAAVGVAKKLLSDGNDKDAAQQQPSTRSRRSGSRGKTQSRSTRKSSSSSGRASSSASSRKQSSSRRQSSPRTRSSSRSGSSSQSGRTKEQLYNQAKRLNIEGRSSMTKAQLERAISRKRS